MRLWPWMALNDLERPKRTLSQKRCFLEPTAQIWMKIDPYYRQQKCRPMTLVSENIRFMRIFAGVPLSGGVKRHRGLSRTANDCKMNDLEWPWVAISWQNAFSASTSWIRAFECQKWYNLCDSAVFCALHDQLASQGRHVQLTRCFSAVAELFVLLMVVKLLTVLYSRSVFYFWFYCAAYWRYNYKTLIIE